MAPSKVPRSSWTDDDGTGTYGTIINNTELQKIYDGIDALHSGNAPYQILEIGGAVRASGGFDGALNGAQITAGQIPLARLGVGTPNAGMYLRGDGAWATLGTAGTIDPPFAGDANAPFQATLGYFWNLVGAGWPGWPNGSGAYVVLPALAGNGGKIVGFVMKQAGNWPIYGQTNEPIVGQNPYMFNWPQYSSLVLKADPASSAWVII